MRMSSIGIGHQTIRIMVVALAALMVLAAANPRTRGCSDEESSGASVKRRRMELHSRRATGAPLRADRCRDHGGNRADRADLRGRSYGVNPPRLSRTSTRWMGRLKLATPIFGLLASACPSFWTGSTTRGM